MKKYLLLISFFLLASFQTNAVELWKEGVHFTVLDKPTSKKPEITEFFSFWCGHCYNFEPLVAKIKEKKAENVKFNKVHVNFMGFASKETQNFATTALMVGRAEKRSEELNNAIFEYIHRKRGVITSLKDLRNIFAVNDVDPEKFDKLASSFGVNSMIKKNNKQVDDYRQHLGGVPNFIVNGKYQATFTNDMSADDMVDLIVWLSTQP